MSPLKALSNDIQKNLATPLEEIASLAKEAGTPFPEIRTAVRTGDTKQSERQRMAKKPPHILITTPEFNSRTFAESTVMPGEGIPNGDIGDTSNRSVLGPYGSDIMSPGT